MSDKKNPFKERSFCVSSDFSLDELNYLFDKGKDLKNAWFSTSPDRQKLLSEFRINNPHLGIYLDPDFGIYDAFFENSTRTDHSSKNAAKFHHINHLSFDPGKSSLSKSESYADTFMTLAGYNNKIFIIRTKLEGVCKWLDIKGLEFFEQGKLEFKPAFINAGDGKHEHPTQELLDDFTFLEDNNWDRSHLHIALIGDLLHGRTVHSKVDGLKIFKEVEVDLIAPEIIKMPEHYTQKMIDNGFKVRIFESLEEYYSQKHIARKQYFTRPQLERMGDEIIKIQNSLREKIVFKRDFLDKLPENTYFYHPFPRHREHPTIPEFLDTMPLNHYSVQSSNGKIMRIILLSAIAGKIGFDFEGETVKQPEYSDSFIVDVTPDNNKKKIYKEGINPLENGVVIDHISRGEKEPYPVWDYLIKVMDRMNFTKFKGSIHVGESKKNPGSFKGIIFLPKIKSLTDSELKKLSAITGGCTVNQVVNNKIERKAKLLIPPRTYGIKGIGCKNINCISHESHIQNVPSEFITEKDGKMRCIYCDTPHNSKEIWRK